MKKLISAVILAVMIVASNGYCADEAQRPREFGGIVAGVASKTATVTAIDPVARTVTLKDADGKEETVICGPEVRNFAQIEKGDTVKVDYAERVKVIVRDDMAVPQRQDTVEVSRAPLGKKPGGVITATTQVLATVEAIDYQKRTVRLKGPVRTIDLEVGADAPNFNMVKVGDTVYLEVTASTAISVTK